MAQVLDIHTYTHTFTHIVVIKHFFFLSHLKISGLSYDTKTCHELGDLLYVHIIILKIFQQWYNNVRITRSYTNISNCTNSAFKEGSCSIFGITVIETPLFYSAFSFYGIHSFTKDKTIVLGLMILIQDGFLLNILKIFVKTLHSRK